MHDPKLALADKLTSQGGVNSWEENKELHGRVLGVNDTNDMVENIE